MRISAIEVNLVIYLQPVSVKLPVVLVVDIDYFRKVQVWQLPVALVKRNREIEGATTLIRHLPTLRKASTPSAPVLLANPTVRFGHTRQRYDLA